MNKNKLKAYAPEARKAFIQAVTDRAHFWGLSESGAEPLEEKGDVAIIGGRPFPRKVAAQRRSLEEHIRREGFAHVMEEVAYTWFNRFMALRYMEIHGYLEHGCRVLSNPTGSPIPEILEKAAQVDLTGLDKQKIIELKLDGTKDAELYHLLLIAQCNALHVAMPFLFEKINDATELLLPDNMLHSNSLISKLVSEIAEDDWQEVEIVGWLYQFYISEKKDQVIGKVVKSEDIPAATQLFTPNWIVKYMVQNSLGRMWLATYPNSPLRAKMEYYIEPAEQTDEVNAQLKAITPDSLDPEKLTFLDPAKGSGHILVEAYDIFKEIYLERGYSSRDFPRLILEKNLYGLDIDDRAAQMAGFALLMKARKDDRRILQNGNPPKLNVMAIQGSEGLNAKEIAEYLLNKTTTAVSRQDIAELLELFRNGKTFGSLIMVPEVLAEKLPALSAIVTAKLQSGDIFAQQLAEAILPIIEQAKILAGKYDCVVANPPYMGGKGMNGSLKSFLQDNYTDVKSDLFSAFIVRNTAFALPKGQLGFMSPFVWMFISSYEKLRRFLINKKTITSLVQLEYSGFDGATVPICTFTVENAHNPYFNGGYVRLSDFRGADNQCPKTLEAINNPDCGWFYRASSSDFKKIPGSPIAYWVSNRVRAIFNMASSLDKFADIGKGLDTGDNNRFLRFWHETKKGTDKWIPCQKGGSYRKWYGNNDYVINWEDDGKELKQFEGSNLRNSHNYFKTGLTWTRVSSSKTAFRSFPAGSIFESTGPCLFPTEISIYSFAAFLNSKLTSSFLRFIAPTLDFQSGHISKLPILKDSLYNEIVNKNSIHCIFQSKSDWDSYETSWDFTINQLLQIAHRKPTIEATYAKVRAHWQEMTTEMQRMEEENNHIFIDAYGLQDELTPDVPFAEITLTCNPHYRYGGDKIEDDLETMLLADTIKELISYAIGCMMGRYSLDQPGLVYANAGNVGFDHERYKSFPADDDGIVPIMDMDWFPDDAASRFEEFLNVAFAPSPQPSPASGEGALLEENLTFVADSLSPRSGETPRDTIRRYISTQFFKDHMQTYKKRPIYWLFSSGKQRAFECLVYLHRYNEATLSRMRNEYVTPLQGKFAARADYLTHEIDAASTTSARSKLQKQLDGLKKKQAELVAFDDLLRHYADQRIHLDLDDGVKVNYGKFGNLLAEVRTITGGSE